MLASEFGVDFTDLADHLRVVNADRAMEIAAVRYVEEQRRRASRDRMPVPEPRDGATLANLEPPV